LINPNSIINQLIAS